MLLQTLSAIAGGPTPHAPPSADTSWIFAGTFSLASGGFVGIWQFGGVPNHLDDILHPVVTSSATTAADSTVASVPGV